MVIIKIVKVMIIDFYITNKVNFVPHLNSTKRDLQNTMSRISLE